MLDTYLCRYGNQDIHKLRGVTELSAREKQIFAACLHQHMEVEYPTLDGEALPG